MLRALEPPPATANEAPVMCQECGTWWQVEPGPRAWHCPRCNRNAAFAYQPGRCPECSASTMVIRVGHDVRRIVCECNLSPEQQRDAERRARYLREKAETQRQLESARQAQTIAMAHDRQEARECWQDRGECCTEPEKRLPHPYCKACVRFR